MEHYGTTNPEEVADPASEDFWDMWNARATTNTNIYHEVFRAEPSDSQESYDLL